MGKEGLGVFIKGPNGVRDSTCCKARRCGSRFLVTVSRGCVRWDPLIKTPRKEKNGKAKLSGGTCPLLLKVTCRLWGSSKSERERKEGLFLSFFLADVAHSRAIPRALFGWSWLLKRGPTKEVTCVSICHFAKPRFGERCITGPNDHWLSIFFGGGIFLSPFWPIWVPFDRTTVWSILMAYVPPKFSVLFLDAFRVFGL